MAFEEWQKQKDNMQKEKVCYLRELAEKGHYEQFMEEFMVVPNLYRELGIDENGKEIASPAYYDHKWKIRGYALFEKLNKVEMGTLSAFDNMPKYGNNPKGVYLADGIYLDEDEVWW